MKIATIESLDTSGVSCSVPTEEKYCDLFMKNIDTYSSIDKTLLAIDWVRAIKKYGLQSTQHIIDNIKRQMGDEFSKSVAISQHIHCNMLEWYECSVFSCHATQSDNCVSIPHWPINCNIENIHQKFKRDVFASFMGSFETHATRRMLAKNESILCIDTGKWHFELSNLGNENKYKDLLSRSVYSICPRGTGHGTIRLWESIASGCIPVIISDGYKIPDTLPEDCYVLVSEKDCSRLSKFLNRDEVWIEKAQSKIANFYEEYLKPSNFHKSILFHLTRQTSQDSL